MQSSENSSQGKLPPNDLVPSTDPFRDLLRTIENLRERLEIVESAFRAAQSAGVVQPYPGFVDHIAHVMKKHFAHDTPDTDANGGSMPLDGSSLKTE